MSEALEAISHLFGFWRFVFSGKFRSEFFQKFKRMGLAGKLLEIVVALVSTLVGLGVPAMLVYLVISGTGDADLATP